MLPFEIVEDITLPVSFIFVTLSPWDEPILKSIVYMGLAPTFDRMVDEIRRNIA